MTDNYRDEMREALAGLIAGMDAGTFEARCIADDEEELQAKVDATDDLWTNARTTLSRLSTQGDEYHTMDDLYAHRFALTAALVKRLPPESSCKSRKNGDGSVWDGLFVVYINTPQGQVSYHYKIELWDKMPCREVETPPPYDGHTPESTLDRLMSIEAFSAQADPALDAREFVRDWIVANHGVLSMAGAAAQDLIARLQARLSASGQGEGSDDPELVELWAVVMEAIVEIDHGRPTRARDILVSAYDDGLPCQRQPAAPAPEKGEKE